MNTQDLQKNTQGGFIRFLIIIIAIGALLYYFNISAGEVVNYITQALNYIITLAKSLLDALIKLGQGVGNPGTPQI